MSDDADEALTLIVEMSRATDEGLRAAVRRLAPRLILDQTRRGTPQRRGVARQRPVPATSGGEIDLDRSMDAIVAARAEARMPGMEELTASAWARPELALCLVIDRSGSMNGERLTTAAVAGAACVARAPREHAVIAFAAEPSVVTAFDVHRPPARTIDDVLQLRGHGTTALAAALVQARTLLARTRARRRVVVLLSDCRPTDGVDPVGAARSLDELLVLAPSDDSDAARQLAVRAGGKFGAIDSVLDVPRVPHHQAQAH
ncbi:MAG: VWA domain-containing protein [Aeromicrobium sp.]|uniref:VWA domain-containing protein n=1 Tax=Aeromicrobium sp. TaxID=1871063 RepID=UPI002615ECB4|nr:VWA domain-containing protein [Aeromicrobium sp.]MDF1706414.1 VWA domain-containing protein [Aeromicrobium sp.]